MRAQIRPDSTHTVADCLGWPDDIRRCELIDGIMHDSSPAPAIEHQRLSSVLHFELYRSLEERKASGIGGCDGCQPFTASIDLAGFRP